MARKKASTPLTDDEVVALDSFPIEGAQVDDDIVVGGVNLGEAKVDVDNHVDPRWGPPMYSEGWQEFVTSQFVDGETTEEGFPFVHGLRRVARKLLGPTLFSGVLEVQSEFDNLGINGEALRRVRANYRLTILWTRPEDAPNPYEVTFVDAADVNPGNIDPAFAKFAIATACTRAEARCLRKALQLRKCAAEELNDSISPEGKINDTQINFIDTICDRIDVNVISFVNSGEFQYKRIDDVPFDRAQKMVQRISKFQNDRSKIPAGIVGYQSGWRV